jgi:hypothetical protein
MFGGGGFSVAGPVLLVLAVMDGTAPTPDSRAFRRHVFEGDDGEWRAGVGLQNRLRFGTHVFQQALDGNSATHRRTYPDKFSPYRLFVVAFAGAEAKTQRMLDVAFAFIVLGMITAALGVWILLLMPPRPR